MSAPSYTAPSFAPTGRRIKEVASLRDGDTVFDESATQNYRLGTIFAPDDGSGRIFRYTKNGAVALAAGLLAQAPAPIANHQEHVGGAGTVGAVGSKEITVGLTMTTALTANQYNDGWVHVNLATGLGYAYRIKSHTNSATPVLTLDEPIQVALDTTSEITLTHNPYNGVIVAPTTLTAQLLGVPRIAVTASYYFWLQTAGPAAVLVDTAEILAIGENAGYPTTISVAGACGLPAVTDPKIGQVMSVNDAAEYALIYLTMDA